MPKELAVLINVEKYFSGHQVSFCYEAGCGYWIARLLKQNGWKVIV
jgi:hypothetical protein